MLCILCRSSSFREADFSFILLLAWTSWNRVKFARLREYTWGFWGRWPSGCGVHRATSPVHSVRVLGLGVGRGGSVQHLTFTEIDDTTMLPPCRGNNPVIRPVLYAHRVSCAIAASILNTVSFHDHRVSRHGHLLPAHQNCGSMPDSA